MTKGELKKSWMSKKDMKKGKDKLLKRLIILLVIGLVFLFIVYLIKIENMKEGRVDYCEQDSDCKIQPTSCCNCFRALNKEITILDGFCDLTVQCPSCPWTLENTKVKCIKHKCTLVEK